MEQIVLGLSGGVDSAVAAGYLREGYRVTGVYLDTGTGSPDAAREAAASLGIGLIVRDVLEAFEREVVAPFAREYAACRTPNPCVLCNRRVKLAALFAAADELGAAYVATGHYARRAEYRGRPAIARARTKDQSYMLWYIRPEWQSRLLFPLGEAASKDEVRGTARELGLAAAGAPDSQDICFVPDGDYAAFLERRGMRPVPGDIVDGEGHVLGRHEGLFRYTVGQRRGLGVAAGERVYVSRLDREENRVVLSRGEILLRDTVRLSGTAFLQDAPAPGGRYEVKLRLGAAPVPCTVESADGEGGMTLRLDAPVRMAAPGQSAVLYDGDVLIGGGFIEEDGRNC